jgi:hypothetical protein
VAKWQIGTDYKGVTFPMELVEEIIQYVAEDHEVLKSCSLACHTWLNVCRPHLFRRVYLDHFNTDEFASLSLPINSTIPIFARNLELVSCQGGDRRWLRRLVPFLTVMTHILYLHLENVDWTGLHDQSKRNLIFTFTATLTHLTLSNISFATLREVTTLASSFPLLESLALIQITWQSAPCVQDISIVPDTLDRLRAPLRSLILHSTSIRPIMAWLISHDPPHPVTSLDIDSIRMEDKLMIGSYFKVLGYHLQDLKLGFDRDVYSDAVSDEAPAQCPGLSGLLSIRVRSFEITNFFDGSAGSSSAAAAFWALQMLRTLDPSMLETVGFVIKSLSMSGELDGHAIHWNGLDTALNGSAYDGLRCVRFEVEGSVNRDGLAALIRARLPLCDARRILCIQ